MIDIDGNGPHPPAYVYCDMANELTTTTISTNLPPEMVILYLFKEIHFTLYYETSNTVVHF